MNTLDTQQAPAAPSIPAEELSRRAEECLGRGRTTEALALLEQFLALRPGNGRIWQLTGRLNHSLGRYDRAFHCFERSASLPGSSPEEAVVPMIRACLKAGKLPRALSLLRAALKAGSTCPVDEALVLDVVDALEQDNQVHSALCLLLDAKERLDAVPQAEHKIADLRGRRAKLAVFCGGDGMAFFRDILDYLRQRYQVRLFKGSNTRQMQELMDWCDIAWFEWCSNLAVLGTQLPKTCRTVIRLHRYEAYTAWPKEIRWDNVDLLITVGNSHVIRALETHVPQIRRQVPLIRIPNGVNLDNIPFRKRSPGKSIAFVASMRMVKNPMLLLQCMARLHAIDPAYRLHIAGNMNELLTEQYFSHQVKALNLEGVVRHDGWQEDILAWLEDKHYIVSTSVIESQGMGILEAMAAGLKPVIHNFPGAAENFDPAYLFNTPEEFCDRILTGDYDSVRCREFVESRYPLNRTLLLIDEKLAALEPAPSA